MHGFVLIFINPFITKRPLQEYIKKKKKIMRKCPTLHFRGYCGVKAVSLWATLSTDVSSG